MEIHQRKNLLLCDSLGLEGLKFFIVENNENIIDELLYDFKKCKITNQKITLCTMKVSTNNWEKLVHTKKGQLTDTAQNFFHLLNEIYKLKRTNEMNILIVEHLVQEITHSSCGLFQLLKIYKSIFDLDKVKCKIINHETLNKNYSIEEILHEIVSTDADENEQEIENFKK